MVVAFYFRLHLAYFPRPVVAIFARPEHRILIAVSLHKKEVSANRQRLPFIFLFY